MYNSNLKIWDVNTSQLVKETIFSDKNISQPLITNKGKLLIYSTPDSMAYFFDIENAKVFESLHVGSHVSVMDLSNSNNFFIAGQDSFRVWQRINGKYKLVLSTGYSYLALRCADFSPNDSLLAYGNAIMEGYILSTSRWDTVFNIYGNGAPITGTKYTNDNKYLYIVYNNYFRVRTTNNLKEIYSYGKPDKYQDCYSNIIDLIVSDDNSILITSLNDGSLIRWKTQGITGIQNENKNIEYETLYPNPVCETLNIKSSIEINNITIIDMLGKSVKINTKSNKNNLCSFDVSGLRSGVYLLSYLSGKDFNTIKFIKE
jgi:hypothetical protein